MHKACLNLFLHRYNLERVTMLAFAATALSLAGEVE
jgi:hypothetical protein